MLFSTRTMSFLSNLFSLNINIVFNFVRACEHNQETDTCTKQILITWWKLIFTQKVLLHLYREHWFANGCLFKCCGLLIILKGRISVKKQLSHKEVSKVYVSLIKFDGKDKFSLLVHKQLKLLKHHYRTTMGGNMHIFLPHVFYFQLVAKQVVSTR